MRRVTFTGRNASGFVACFGYTFPHGVVVEVDEEAIGEANFRRLKGHAEFTVHREADPAPQPEETEAATEPSRAVKRRTSQKGK